MKLIPLSQGYFAEIDDDDFEKINAHNWWVHIMRNKYFYAEARINGKVISMHRFIMNCPKNKQIDHIDHDGLNNQKSNLRICTSRQNQQNKYGRQKSSSKIYRTVKWI
jgi:hypothetical protein